MATIASDCARMLYIMKKAAFYFQLGAHVCITWLLSTLVWSPDSCLKVHCQN